MKLPVSWLREYVDFDDTAERLAERLTFSGLEVEALEKIGTGLENIVIAEIRAVEDHPNADRLKVCRVFDGYSEKTVVCGADNFKAGDKAPLAREGVMLPNGARVRTANLRGVVSEGMLCAEDELGWSDDHAGIVIMPEASRAGTSLDQALDLPETVLTVEVTPNRADCLSVIGMAREVAALYRVPLMRPRAQPVVTRIAAAASLAVTVADPKDCARYTARFISGCRVESSPQWLRWRLMLCGMRPINNVVDITNYVMLECGQPLHAFDAARLNGKSLQVRRARAGETLALLDETRRKLDPSMTVIADEVEPVAIAGVMGGERSGVDQKTTDIVLESAAFSPSQVRKTARQLGVSTEASYRFERGVDPEGCAWAGLRAATLLTELSGGNCARSFIDVRAPEPPPSPVRLRTERVCSVLGYGMPDKEIVEVLTALDFRVSPGADKSEYSVLPPSYRADVSIEEDLIEEVARINGLDKIPVPDPCARVVPDADDMPVREAMRYRERLAGMGLREIMNYSFVSHALLDLFLPDSADERLVLPHPLSAEHSVMRPSLIPQMVETLGRNHARQVGQAALFESGRVFRRTPEGECVEEDRLAVGLMGPVGRHPLDKQRPVAAQEIFLWIKGIARNMLFYSSFALESGVRREGLSPEMELTPLQHSCYDSGRAFAVAVQGKKLGAIGIVARHIAAEWRLNFPVAVLEMALAPLLPSSGQRPTQLKGAPVFPSVRRDMAMIVPQKVSHGDIMRVIREKAPPELTSASPFDIFIGEGIGTGEKSLAYALTYRADDRTLTDDEVNRMHLKIRENVSRRLKATMRE